MLNHIYKRIRKPKVAYLLAAISLIIIGLSGYWLKSRVGIDFFEHQSFSKHFPFKHLVPNNNYIADPSPGLILLDSFDSSSPFSNWTRLWAREKGMVIKGVSKECSANNLCLSIKSNSTQSWSISHNTLLRVKKGDTFRLKVSVKLHGKKLSAYAGVAAFNKSQQAISWSYIIEETERVGEWVNLEKTFTVSDNIDYIRFKLAGTGVGEFLFDDVIFLKK